MVGIYDNKSRLILLTGCNLVVLYLISICKLEGCMCPTDLQHLYCKALINKIKESKCTALCACNYYLSNLKGIIQHDEQVKAIFQLQEEVRRTLSSKRLY